MSQAQPARILSARLSPVTICEAIPLRARFAEVDAFRFVRFHARFGRLAEVREDDGKHHANQQAHQHIREQQRHAAEHAFDEREHEIAQRDEQQPAKAPGDPLLFHHAFDGKVRCADDAEYFDDLVDGCNDVVGQPRFFNDEREQQDHCHGEHHGNERAFECALNDIARHRFGFGFRFHSHSPFSMIFMRGRAGL